MRRSKDKPSLTPEMARIVRALEPHANTIRNALWAFNVILWTTAIVLAVLVWRSL